MNGKLFKAWAATINDDAVIEVKNEYRNYHEFEPLNPRFIRAYSLSYPAVEDEANEQEKP